ncbi:hypothetical protein [Kitasatospora sp. NPDC059571]|uniref:hypothetical protein n=1 Tax=Kitasatospora sp. NPDC059571 TaxID=3346871 RepID=UPI0036B54DE0
MRSGLVQVGAWAVATGAAVALSWYGVHAVLADAAFEHPRAVPLPTASATPVPDPPSPVSDDPSVTVTAQDPSPSPSASSSSAAPSPSPSRTKPQRPPSPSSVRSYLVPGGRVALDIHPDRADLVSATPDAGWQMQVWNGDQWMRIDFTKDGSANSVFVTWNGHPPDVQTVVR